MSNDTEPSTKTVQEELDKALALLVAERRANALLKAEKDEALDRLRVRHTLQLEEAAAQLDTERKEKDEAVRKLKSVVAEINGSETLQAIRRTLDSSVTTTTATALDWGNPGVVVLSNNVRSKNTTTNTCTFSVDIHEEPEVLLEALFGEQTKVGKTLFQKVIGEGVAYWSFMQCRLTLVQQFDAGGVIPTWVGDSQIPKFLLVVQEAIEEFRQDDRIDAAVREELSMLIKESSREEVYSEAENALLERVHQKFEGSLEERKWTKLKVRSLRGANMMQCKE